MDYGTGAIMAVPGARRARLRVRASASTCRSSHGESTRRRRDVLGRLGAVHRAAAPEAKRAIVEWLGGARPRQAGVNYRLRDWGFSRQRYWGCPIPVVHCDAAASCPCPTTSCRCCCRRSRTTCRRAAAARGGRGLGATSRARVRRRRRSARPTRWTPSSTRPGTSCATATRTTTARRSTAALVDYWCPVNQYIGGIEHATVHLMYSRFFTKALNDLGIVGFREPFARLFNQGWMLPRRRRRCRSRRATSIAPDELVERYGADALRLYILFIGPADQDMEWTETGVEGMARFLRRLWRIVHEVARARAGGRRRRRTPLARKAHETIAQGDRRHRAALRLQHADRGGDGARQRARRATPRRPGGALRGRDRGLADPAVRAARRRGAVVGARPRAAVGGSRGRSPTSRSCERETIELVCR